MNTRRYAAALIVAGTLAVGIVIGTVVSRGVRAAKVSPVAPDARALPPPSPRELSNSFATIADEVSPSVVNIKTETTIRVSRKRFNSPDGSPFEDFFDRYFHFGPGDVPHDFPQSSLGSGVILDKAGYILTNYHVVMRDGEDKAVDRMRIFLQGEDDGSKSYAAKIVGTDKWTDLAVIKISAGKPLPAATLGDSDLMRVGDWVLAIGSPFGLSSTVTAGIVSAKGRGIEAGREGEFKKFIQTDAAINPGNSGGPLVNLAAQVIGINTAIATSRDAYDGVGFAIPSNTVRHVYNEIVTTGHVRRGAVGVTFTNSGNEAVLRSLGADHGVVVDSVEPGTPAERAGLERGDVITAINSKAIRSGDEMLTVISGTDPGTKLKVEFQRDGKPMSAEIVVGDWNEIVGQARSPQDAQGGGQEGGESHGVLGLAVKNLNAEQAQELGRALRLKGAQGVLVTEVKPGSFAYDLGLAPADVILSLNRKSVESVEDFKRLESQLKSGDDVLFLIARQNEGSYTTLFLADRLP